MKFRNSAVKYGPVLAVVGAISTPVSAQVDDGSTIATALGELATTAGVIIAALIAFGVAWYLGKKVYNMTKA